MKKIGLLITISFVLMSIGGINVYAVNRYLSPENDSEETNDISNNETFLLRFSHEIGRKYRIKNIVQQHTYYNGVRYESHEAMFKNILEVTDITNGYGLYEGEFVEYMRNYNLNESFNLISTHNSEFYRDELGEIVLKPFYIYPTVRNVPLFPEEEVAVGEFWSGTATEYLEITDYEIDTVFDLEVDYSLLGIITNDEETLAKISVDYSVMHIPQNNRFVSSFSGYSHMTYYFDITAGAPHSYSDRFDFMITLIDGSTIRYEGTSQAEVEFLFDITNQQLEDLTEIIADTIEEDPGVDVEQLDDGILVNLGSILFDINQATLKDDAYESLEELAEIMLEYPELDIEVSGHTDITGTDEYNQVLSENRAKTVSDYLIDEGISSTRISYFGVGSEDPIADNDTEEGRTENRRVEIKIITVE